MYNNIGSIIKTVAIILTIVGVFLSILYGCSMIVNGGDGLIGFAYIIAGSIVSWFSNLLLYAFGQLVENSDILAEHAEYLISKYKKTPSVRKNKTKSDTDNSSDFDFDNDSFSTRKEEHKSPNRKCAACRKETAVRLCWLDDSDKEYYLCQDCRKKYNARTISSQ